MTFFSPSPESRFFIFLVFSFFISSSSSPEGEPSSGVGARRRRRRRQSRAVAAAVAVGEQLVAGVWVRRVWRRRRLQPRLDPFGELPQPVFRQRPLKVPEAPGDVLAAGERVVGALEAADVVLLKKKRMLLCIRDGFELSSSSKVRVFVPSHGSSKQFEVRQKVRELKI